MTATVVGKHEELSVHDSPRGEWSRDYRVGVEFRTADGAIGSSSVRVARGRFDSLQIGEHIAIRYLPALPHYARLADRSTAQVLREAVSVFLDDSFLTPLLTWLVMGGAALLLLAQFTTAAVFIAGVLWIVPIVAIAAILYWLFGSGKLPVGLPTLAFGYLIGLPLGLLFPPAAMGAVAGTAAGHAWREPGARTLIVVLVIFVMLVAAVELPLAAATVDGPLLPPLPFP